MHHQIRSLPRSAQLYLLYTFVGSLYFAWPIFIAYLSQRFGIASAGLFFTILSLSALFFEVPTGYIADRFGRKLSIIMGIIFKIMGIIILVLGVDSSTVIWTALLYGAGLALISGAMDALLYGAVTHEEYEQTTSHSVPFYQVGLIASALLGGFLFEINIHLPVIAEGISLLILIVPVVLMSKDTHDASGELSVRQAFGSLKRIFTIKASLIFLAVYLMCATVMNLFLEIILERRMIELVITPSQRGLLIGGVKIFAILALQAFIMNRIKTVRAKAIFAFGSGIVSFGLIGMTQGNVIFIILYVLTNPFTMLDNAIVNPIMQRLSRHNTRATDISMYTLLSRLAFAAVAPLAGWYLVGHSTAGLYILCALGLLIVSPLLFQTLAWYEKSASQAR